MLHLERAQKIQGWCNLDDMTWLASKAQTANVIIEIGIWRGRTTRIFCDNCPGSIYSIDHWKGNTNNTHQQEVVTDPKRRKSLIDKFRVDFKSVLNSGKLTVIEDDSCGTSLILEKLLKFRGGADLVFIDGDHQFESVLFDISNYRNLVSPKGVLCGHDYKWDAVKKAVEGSFKETGYQLGTENIWYVQY